MTAEEHSAKATPDHADRMVMTMAAFQAQMHEMMDDPVGGRMSEPAAEVLIQRLCGVSVLYLCHIHQRGDRSGYLIP